MLVLGTYASAVPAQEANYGLGPLLNERELEGLGGGELYTIEPTPGGGVRMQIDPGQRLFTMDVRRNYGLDWSEIVPEDKGLAPILTLPNGRVTAAPIFDPTTQVYRSPEGGLPVDIEKLFDQGAELPYLSMEERDAFQGLLDRYENLSTQERTRFRELFNKGVAVPYGVAVPDAGPPAPLPPLERQPDDSVPIRTGITSKTCDNGKTIRLWCAYVTGPKLPEYCKCD